MATVLAFHEVEDFDKWLSSPKREEFFSPHGITFRTFKDPKDPNRVALIMEVPDPSILPEILGTDEAAATMQHDGVRPETLALLEEA